MQKKIIIFGAGRAGLNALTYLQEQGHQILAFCDNDITKQGTFIQNLPVIAPDQLASLPYEQLAIASMYASEISKQLEQQLKIASSKIIILPSYICLTAAGFSIENENQILSEAIHIFDKENITYYLDNSALLGFVRSKNFLPWPHGGIDFSICTHFHSGSDIENIISKYYPSNQIKLTRTGCQFNAWDPHDILGVKIVDDQSRTLFTVSIRYLLDDFVYWTFGPYIARVPSYLLLNFSYLKINNDQLKVRIPEQYQEYLKMLYGDDWMIPKKDWHWSESKHIYKEISDLGSNQHGQ